jgi:diadenosine tetraphosphate (Ap4A) HIT family hydrolase
MATGAGGGASGGTRDQWHSWLMPESAEEVYARVVAAVGPDGHLPMPPVGGWDIFPWEIVDGALVPKTLPPPSDEPGRQGEAADNPCPTCAGIDPARVVWEDEHWVLTHGGQPSGLPLVLMLHTREHLDFGDFDDDLASECGRIANRLTRIIEHLPHIGRVHTMRIGDFGSHFHLWFFARTARLTNVLGSPALEWDEILPPGPEEVWRADLHTVATKLANWGGDARA